MYPSILSCFPHFSSTELCVLHICLESVKAYRFSTLFFSLFISVLYSAHLHSLCLLAFSSSHLFYLNFCLSACLHVCLPVVCLFEFQSYPNLSLFLYHLLCCAVFVVFLNYRSIFPLFVHGCIHQSPSYLHLSPCMSHVCFITCCVCSASALYF